MFTARAVLEADLLATAWTPAMYMSGRIDNFRGTAGVFLGDDTQAIPTIRNRRGERLGRDC